MASRMLVLDGGHADEDMDLHGNQYLSYSWIARGGRGLHLLPFGSGTQLITYNL